MPVLGPTMKKRHNGGNDKPVNKTCIRKPQQAVYNVTEFSHQHASATARYGFVFCEGELVKRWPKTIRKSAWNDNAKKAT